MRRVVSFLAIASLSVGLSLSPSVAQVEHSDNIRVLATYKHRGGPVAFEGNRLVRESGEGFTISRLSKKPPFVRREALYVCPTGTGRSISLWRGFVIQSGYPGRTHETPDGCNDTDSHVQGGGIRFVDVRDPEDPKQVHFIDASCDRWSPGHALLPRGRTIYVYDVFELPYCYLGDPEPLYMKVIRFDPDRPQRTRSVSTPDSGGVEGCDRLTVHVERRLLACSAINRLSLFDLDDPANPSFLGLMTFNSGFLWEASFTWDGDYLVMGQYLNGGDGCDLIIVDVRDPAFPVEAGRLDPPRAAPGSCPYPFSVQVLPTRDEDRYLAIVGWRGSGMSVVDFTDPAKPFEHAYYAGDDVRYAYWYNGRIYAFTSDKEVVVLALQGAYERSTHYFRRFYPHTQYESFKS